MCGSNTSPTFLLAFMCALWCMTGPCVPSSLHLFLCTDLAQSISFHISSLAPPSPIMVQLTNEDAWLREGKAPPSKRGKKKTVSADVTLKE